MEKELLKISDLTIQYSVENSVCQAVNHVDLKLNRGETLGLVGETGAGKTTIALGIMGLVPDPPGRIVGGTITFDGLDLVKATKKELREIRGKKISMIFQDPMTALNPIDKVGDQIREVIELHNKGMSKAEAAKKACDTLELVGIPAERYDEYPHQFSGGMKQRIVIAIALACNPELLLADEPTTALDVTIQAQIVELLKELKDKLGMAIIFITHDLGVVSEICDKIIVMYAGKVVEEGMSRQIFYERCHPYTEGLLASVPKLDSDVSEKLKPIKGNPPDMSAVKPGCAFAPRCSCAMKICVREEPPECELDETHKASCWQVIKKAMQNT